MEQRPLSLPEFIGPLSLCAATMDDQYDDYKVSLFKFQFFRNSLTTSPETVNAELRSKQPYGETMATAILRVKRKREKEKKESDYKDEAERSLARLRLTWSLKPFSH